MGEEPKIVYADHNATYPCSASHITEISQIWTELVGNPSSIHGAGRKAKRLLEGARREIADFLGATPQEIFFCSGATEANAIAINHYKNFLLSAGEHPAVSNTITQKTKNGCQQQVIPLKPDGSIDLEGLLQNLKPETECVCLIHVHNETGVINPVFEIAKTLKQTQPNLHVHIDGVQALGKLEFDLSNPPFDSMAFSGHKIGALSGIGLLYWRQSSRHSLWHGGKQEASLRPGTENLPGALSLALRLKELQQGASLLPPAAVYQNLETQLKQIKNFEIFGTNRLANVICFYPGQDIGERLLIEFDLAGICISAGSACAAGESLPSATILGMGHSKNKASNTLRISLGEQNTNEDVNRIMTVIHKVLN